MLVIKVLSVLAIESGHSDPAKLKETAESVQQLSSDKLKIRQLEIKVRIILLMENKIVFLFSFITLEVSIEIISF